MTTIRFQITEQLYAYREQRSFRCRARADRAVGLWAASQRGLSEEAADTYAASVVRAGVSSTDGRGGFDKIAADLAFTTIHVEAIRSQYALAMASMADHLFEQPAAAALHARRH